MIRSYLLIRGLQVVAAIVQVDRHAAVAVRKVGMIEPAELIDHRIDLDGIDTIRAPLQRAADIVARSGADHQHSDRTAIDRRPGSAGAAAHTPAPGSVS